MKLEILLRRRRAGFTLVEVMVAMAIAAFVSLGFMASIVYTLRESAGNREHLSGLLLADYYQGAVLAADYTKLGKTTLVSTDYEYLFNRDSRNALAVPSDPTYPDKGETYQLYFELTGFGAVASATDTTLKATFASNQKPWREHEWQNNYVTIVSGFGVGQIMRIVDNTADTLTVTGDMTGVDTNKKWSLTPDSSSSFVINNGKTVRVFLRWQDGSSFRTITRTVLLRHQG